MVPAIDIFLRAFLTGFLKVARLPFERLRQIEDQTLQIFLSPRRIEHQSKINRKPKADELNLQGFLRGLETMVSAMSKRLMSEADSMDSSSINHGLIAMASFSPMVCSNEDQSTLEVLKKHRLVCDEFLFRCRRLSDSSTNPAGDRFDKDEPLNEVHNELMAICTEIFARASRIIFRQHDFLMEFTTFTSLKLSLDSYINELMYLNCKDEFVSHAYRNNRARDALGRNVAHQFLDIMEPTFDKTGWLDTFKKFLTSEEGGVDDEDFLGRTLLHIACQRRWHAGTAWLLQRGANPCAITAYGSLPIHYAAAAGSRSIVKLLLTYESNFHRLQKDSAGVSALRYAIAYSHEAVAKLLGDVPQVKLTEKALEHPELDAGLSKLLIEEPALHKRFSDIDPEGPRLSSTNYYCSPQIAAHALRIVLRDILVVDEAWIQDRPTVTGVVQKIDSYFKEHRLPDVATATSPSAVAFKNALSIILQLAYELTFTSGVISALAEHQSAATLALSLTMRYIEQYISRLAFLPHENLAVGKIYGDREGPLESFVQTNLRSISYNIFQ